MEVEMFIIIGHNEAVSVSIKREWRWEMFIVGHDFVSLSLGMERE